MELRQLRYFSKVAELHSFSEASRQLNITQGTLSQQIKQLEGELGVELLVRDTHNVRLTDVGEAILPQVLHTLADAEDCVNRIRDVKHLTQGVLNIGSTHSFMPLMKETVLQFMRNYPGVKLHIHCGSMDQLLTMLQDQSIDVALSYKPSTHHGDIDSHILFDNRLAVVVADTHPLASRQSVKVSDIENYPLALLSSRSQARNLFEHIIDGKDYKLNVRIEINDVSVLIDLVRASRKMVTVVSQAAVMRLPGIKVLKLDEAGTEMEGSYHTKSGGYMKHVSKEFLRMLRENRSFNLTMMEMYY